MFENEKEYAHAILLFPYSFSKSYSFCGFEGLHRLADICRPFRAWSGMGADEVYFRKLYAEPMPAILPSPPHFFGGGLGRGLFFNV